MIGEKISSARFSCSAHQGTVLTSFKRGEKRAHCRAHKITLGGFFSRPAALALGAFFTFIKKKYLKLVCKCSRKRSVFGVTLPIITLQTKQKYARAPHEFVFSNPLNALLVSMRFLSCYEGNDSFPQFPVVWRTGGNEHGNQMYVSACLNCGKCRICCKEKPVRR